MVAQWGRGRLWAHGGAVGELRGAVAWWFTCMSSSELAVARCSGDDGEN
jgi:hypothetical protein